MKRRFYIFSIFLCLISGGVLRGQDIYRSSALVLPESPATTYTVASGQTREIISTVSVTLKTGVTLSSGSDVTISADPLQAPTAPSDDLDRNWVMVQVYDESGKEVGATKSFFDRNGRPTQRQAKNESQGHVLASQTVYDLLGRAAIQTLAAPVNNTDFAYKSAFMTNSSGSDYNYANFDWTSSLGFGKTNSPDAVKNTTKGSLGWYYSNNNTFEPMVPVSAYPYTRSDIYHDGSGQDKRFAQVDAGDLLKMGAGHESGSNSFPVINELTGTYLGVRNQFFSTAVGAKPTSMSGKGIQTIGTNSDGAKVLGITDLAGNMLLTARADAAGPMTVTNTFTLSANVQPEYRFTVNNFDELSGFGGVNDVTLVNVSSTNVITVRKNNGSSTSQIYHGIGNEFNFNGFITGESLEITSDYPFYVDGYASPTGVAAPSLLRYDHSSAGITKPSGTTIKYFELTSPYAATITGTSGTYRLYNMDSETDITSSFTSGTTVFAAGLYKVASVVGSSGQTGTVSVTYQNRYSDITYAYYNQLGQLIASIAPKGVETLLASGYSSYADKAALPFVTLYEYDLQGRTTAVTTTDGGETEYIYRRDGSIRFSQNALQRAASPERYSYTNYDDIGRPVESGEYTFATGGVSFASAKTNATLQEDTDPDGGLTTGTKTGKVNTYYDVPATNLSLTGYVQDAAFLKGAVSYTSNAASTTWYNYDDHGRVTWLVKQLTGISGKKTVDYTYNDQGNVTVVDYQQGTPAERFIHYYGYDADARLVDVKTSRDGVSRLQQAKYYYYLHGPLKRVELGDNVQGIDYTYTAQGWLKAINSPAGDPAGDPGGDGSGSSVFAADAFGLQMEYFTGDYTRTGSNIVSIPTGQAYYSGNVNGISWQSKKSLSGSVTPSMYAYTYDDKYQLNSASTGTPVFTGTPSFTATNAFKEYNLSYDANGNIKKLARRNAFGTLTDNFDNYAYQAGTNKLTAVGTTSPASTYSSYTYDALGQLKSQTQSGVSSYLKYDVTGKITGVYTAADFSGTPVATYSYDEAGNRIKMVNASGTTYYVYDSAGNILAIYTGTAGTVLGEIPVYGSDRLGTYTVGSYYAYELRDNVGSVRVVINRTKASGNRADVLVYNDYYPFGLRAQGGGTGYRYEYQGAYAEKDPVTGFNNFELRMYDGKIGRWLSVDPKHQYFSPYIGMGNNPVDRSDPDGGDDYDTEEAAQQAARAQGVDPSTVYNNGGKSGWGFNTVGNDGSIVGHFGALANQGGGEGGSYTSKALGASVVLLADDVTGIGAIDDVAIPVIIAGAAVRDLTQIKYITYTLKNASGKTYVGRSSGYGDPYSIMMNRFYSHHMRALGFGNPQLDRVAQGYPLGYYAIRGREQDAVNAYGGIGSSQLGNSINPIWQYNPNRPLYMGTSSLMFGPYVK